MPSMVLVIFRTKKDMTEGQTDELTDGQADGRVNHYMPSFGDIKNEFVEKKECKFGFVF